MVQEGRGHEAEDYGLPERERHVEPVDGLGVQFDAPQTSWRNRMECVRYPSWEWSRLRSHANGNPVSEAQPIMGNAAFRGWWLKPDDALSSPVAPEWTSTPEKHPWQKYRRNEGDAREGVLTIGVVMNGVIHGEKHDRFLKSGMYSEK